jgi:NAD(P)H dehydrogenase (quinone)
MKISVILGHPYERSFNHAIADMVIKTLNDNGHDVKFHDLHKEGFDPLLQGEELISDQSEDLLVLLHCSEIREADGMIIIHPNWWGQPPAILKGWVDRVLREKIAYRFAEDDDGSGLPVGMLKAKVAIVLNTSNTPQEREDTVLAIRYRGYGKTAFLIFAGLLISIAGCSGQLQAVPRRSDRYGLTK